MIQNVINFNYLCVMEIIANATILAGINIQNFL